MDREALSGRKTEPRAGEPMSWGSGRNVRWVRGILGRRSCLIWLHRLQRSLQIYSGAAAVIISTCSNFLKDLKDLSARKRLRGTLIKADCLQLWKADELDAVQAASGCRAPHTSLLDLHRCTVASNTKDHLISFSFKSPLRRENGASVRWEWRSVLWSAVARMLLCGGREGGRRGGAV